MSGTLGRPRPLDAVAAVLAGAAGLYGLRRLGLDWGVSGAILGAIVGGGAVDLRLPGRRGSAPPRLVLNVGGGLIPLALSGYLASRLPASDRLALAVDAALVAASSFALARPEPGRGVVLPWIFPALLAAAVPALFDPARPAAVAFSAAVLGTFLGADLLHLRSLDRIGALRVGLGGSGPGDGLVWSGLLAAILSAGP